MLLPTFRHAVDHLHSSFTGQFVHLLELDPLLSVRLILPIECALVSGSNPSQAAILFLFQCTADDFAEIVVLLCVFAESKFVFAAQSFTGLSNLGVCISRLRVCVILFVLWISGLRLVCILLLCFASRICAGLRSVCVLQLNVAFALQSLLVVQSGS